MGTTFTVRAAVIALFSSAILACGSSGTPPTAPAAPAITSSNPPSPSSSTTPSFIGTAPSGTTVALFASGTCGGSSIGSGSDSQFAAPGIATTVPGNATDSITANATDSGGLVSACSAPFTYVAKSQGALPSVPVLTSTSPASPGKSATPLVLGTSDASTTVKLFGDSACNTVLGSGTAAQLASPGITITVPANSSTNLYVTATNPAGSSACSSGNLSYVMDDTAPASATVSDTTPRSPSNNGSPVVNGSAEPGALVTFFSDAACADAIGDGSVGSNGQFAIGIAVPADSTTELYDTVADAAGNVSACADGDLSYTMDDNIPATPLLFGVNPSSPSNTPDLIVYGAATPGDTLNIFNNGNCSGSIIGTRESAPDGSFEVFVTVPSNATTVLSAQAGDVAGNLSACSGQLTFVEDEIAPAAPQLTSTTPASPANIEATGMVTVNGSATTGTIVGIFNAAACASVPIATGVAVNGAFSIAARAYFNGATQFSAVATDAAGNVSACSSTGLSFVDDGLSPSQPRVDAVTPAGPTSATSVTVTGAGDGEPGTLITLYTDSACATPGLTPTGIVSAGNTFSITVSIAPDTTTSFYAVESDAAGNHSPCSSTFASVTEDNIAPAPPILTGIVPSGPTNGHAGTVSGTSEASATITLYSDSACTAPLGFTGTTNFVTSQFSIPFTVATDQTLTLYATATDLAGNVSGCSSTSQIFIEDNTAPALPMLANISPASPSRNNNPTMTGTAEPGAFVIFFVSTNGSATCDGSQNSGGTAADANGNFIFTGATFDTDGSYTIALRARDAAGNQSACTAGVNYVVDTTAPPPPSMSGTLPASPSNAGGAISVLGSAEAFSTVSLHRSPSCTDTVVASATTGSDENFSVPVNVAHDSTNIFYGTATDLAGNTSLCSTGFIKFVEDNTAPLLPASISLNPPSPGQTIFPALTFNAESGALCDSNSGSLCTIGNVYLTGDCSGTANVSKPILGNFFGDNIGGGAFTLHLPPNTTSTLTIQLVDAAGNISACSAPITYVSDSTPPAPPSLTGTTPASPSSSTNPTLNGTAEANSTVNIFESANCSGTAAATVTATAGTGAFSAALRVPNNSTSSLSANATDAAGNVSTCSSALSYQANGTAPSTPLISASSPSSPSKSSTTPTLTGSADASTTVKLYTAAGCTGTVAGSAATSGTAFSIPVTVAANSTTVFYATATSAASVVSACTATGFVYVNDSIAPSAPSIGGSAPASPSNSSTTPTISGSAEAGSTVKLFTNSVCSGIGAATGSASSGGAFAISVPVTANATTSISANATDAAGNTSTCSTAFSYTNDTLAPATPTWSGTTPASPSRTTTTPTLNGAAETGSLVKVYTGAACTGAVMFQATTSGATFTIAASVSSNTTTNFYATSTDAAGNVSGCSSALTFVNDSIPPAAPIFTGTSPVSPSNSNTTPTLSGTAEANSTVSLYSAVGGTSSCAGSPITLTANSAGVFSTTVTVTANTTTSFSAHATDAAGNVSACVSGLQYTHDNIAPAQPTISLLVPASPSNVRTTAVHGFAEDYSTINLYSTSCSGTPLATGATSSGGSYSLSVTVAHDTSTTFHVNATDAAGNVSVCSAGSTYVEDETAPAAPLLLSTTPASPSSSNIHPVVNGTAEASAAITLYTDPGCAGPLLASGSADSSGILMIPTTVPANAKTTIYGTATDAAGNRSVCSAGRAYVNDSIAPAFAGAASAVSTTNNSMLISWRAATDNLDAPSALVYDVCVSITFNTCSSNFTVSDTSAAGATQLLLNSLDADGRYYVVVRARDLSGNRESNTVQVSARTLGANSVIGVSAGSGHNCALTADGAVWCWGNNSAGQLGDNTMVNRTSPVRASIASFAAFTQIAANGSSTYGLLANGQVFGWGDNSAGQLGNGGTNAAPAGAFASGITNAIQVVAGNAFACALLADRTVRCWGDNSTAEIGDGTTTARSSPTLVSNLFDVAKLSANGGSACALRANGSVECWGDNSAGQLGDGTTVQRATPVPVSGLHLATSVSMGGDHACAILANGTAVCWGSDAYGQLGDGGSTISETPVAVTGLTYLVSIDAAQSSSCAIASNGEAYCWGQNESGQLGSGGVSSSGTPVAITSLPGSVAVSGASASICALSSGTLSCWGDNSSGQLGNASSGNSSTPVAPLGIVGLIGAVQVAGGAHSACALRSIGEVLCWGSNGAGQLGNGSNASSVIPVEATGDAIAIASGGDHFCSLEADGEVSCWGNNNLNQLGDGTSVARSSPVTVSGVSEAIAVAASESYSCALIADGSVSCWGEGIWMNDSRGFAPQTVAGLANVTQIVAGEDQLCARIADGSVSCAGPNLTGGLGDGTTTPSATPNQVSGLGPGQVLSLASSSSGTVCAVIADGTVACWGANESGEIGDGSTTQRLVPKSISLNGTVAVSLGLDSGCALGGTGLLQCWGDNSYDQLGIGDTTDSLSPGPVGGGLVNVKQLSIGATSIYTLTSAGIIEEWGNGQSDQLGFSADGANEPLPTPLFAFP